MIFGDLGGLKVPDICLTGEEKPRKKPHPGNLSRPGIKPGPAAWQARMLPPVPQRWTFRKRSTDYLLILVVSNFGIVLIFFPPSRTVKPCIVACDRVWYSAFKKPCIRSLLWDKVQWHAKMNLGVLSSPICTYPKMTVIWNYLQCLTLEKGGIWYEVGTNTQLKNWKKAACKWESQLHHCEHSDLHIASAWLPAHINFPLWILSHEFYKHAK